MLGAYGVFGEMENVEEEWEEGRMTMGICEPRCLIRYRSVWDGAARID